MQGHFDSQKNVATMTKHKEAMLLGLGREMGRLMMILMASVLVLCVLFVSLILEK